MFRKIFGPHICGDALDIQSQSSSTTSRQILTGSWRKDKTLQIWDYGSGKLLKDIPSDYNGSMVSSVNKGCILRWFETVVLCEVKYEKGLRFEMSVIFLSFKFDCYQLVGYQIFMQSQWNRSVIQPQFSWFLLADFLPIHFTLNRVIKFFSNWIWVKTCRFFHMFSFCCSRW